MSVEIRQYLDNSGGNNFTETAPRPPVGPGEDNELHSTGGHSNKSSGSHRSQTSNRSSSSANGGGATPRRSQKPVKLPPTAAASSSTAPAAISSGVVAAVAEESSKSLVEEADAPLGFEPEGSVDEKAAFTESGSPAYLKWNENLEKLLEDPDGVTLFKTFLTQENGVNLFEFYFAWKCLQSLNAESEANVNSLVRAMYKAFVKGEKKLPFITNEAKERISKQISAKQDPKNTFNSIKDQVFDILNREFYVPFFKSSIYLQYVQSMEGSPKESSVHSSESVGGQPIGLVLPTVHEDSELDLNQIGSQVDAVGGDPPVTLSLTVKNMRITEKLRTESKIKPEEQAGYVQTMIRNSQSYLPVTAIFFAELL